MSQSPELAGGEGFTYEGDVAAFYLTALLAEAYAPGIDDHIVVGVSVQQRNFGEPLDDVIVDFKDGNNNPARLSLQVKRALVVSDAPSNTDFRDIIRDSWATLQKPDFRQQIDRYGAAVGTISADKERTLKTLCDWARESLSTEHFETRFSAAGHASAESCAIKKDIATLLKDTKGSPCTAEELHRFLAHFVLIQFDFLREGATDPSEAINRIRDCLADGEAAKSPLIWSWLKDLARASAGKAGQFDRPRLVRAIAPMARLRGALSLQSDLAKLTALARSYADLIHDDVGGTRLERATLMAKLEQKLAQARIVQVRGLPGSGKSVLLRRRVAQAWQHGPVLFLKAEQLEGSSWISYAAAQGLSGAALEPLLVDIGATGTPILFIDAIDRVAKQQQPIILDLLRTIAESPLLEQWRVVVSLRDTGIELLRNWLGPYLEKLKLESLEVGALSDDEAAVLSKAKPHLHPLLFGPQSVQDIVRRPFFAKVLHQGYNTAPGKEAFAPQSEIDLMEHWWQRGGYNEDGQNALERQSTLLDLAGIRARQLSEPIRLGQIQSKAPLDALRTDGILLNKRPGVWLDFSHDIFFEWAFFYRLANCGPQWPEEIQACGEAPALARVVELTAQWEYSQGQDWTTYLQQLERSNLRSQWLRAWLCGPLGTARFKTEPTSFQQAVFADDYRLLRKTLVWFQAEKTTPNPNILVSGTLPEAQRQKYAYWLGWPSDFGPWRRLIEFILARIATIPARLYPDILAIFEVWQNALSNQANPTSRAALQQCATWLAELDARQSSYHWGRSPDAWGDIDGLDDFHKALAQLLIKASRAEPRFTTEYLQRVIRSEDIRADAFHEILTFSSFLAQSHPDALVELGLAFLLKELPDDQVAREIREQQKYAEERKAILAKPEAERTRQESYWLTSGGRVIPVGWFGHSDWEQISINDDHEDFSSPSPLREPFHSLFRCAPNHALQLFRELCNHAITAWRQLHRYGPERHGTPIPLELTFPWGRQVFWGTDREYLWCQSLREPWVISCGFMALEEWCFAELERGRSVDELIQQIVAGNECIAVLGAAAKLALNTQTVSEATLPLVTSQRLLAADHQRMIQDMTSPKVNLTGFTLPQDQEHYEAVQKMNARVIRRTDLSWLATGFIFGSTHFRERVRSAILDFKNHLPFQYEEHRTHPEAQAHLATEAAKYAELADLNNYQRYRTQDDPEQVAVVHVSPSASTPENIAKADAAALYLRRSGLCAWALTSFEQGAVQSTYSITDAIAIAKEADSEDLFGDSEDGDVIESSSLRGAVAGTAALVLNFRAERSPEELEWAHAILQRAIRLPEIFSPMWTPGAIIPWHPAIFVARGLAADLRENTAPTNAAQDLLTLITHPLEIVSTTAIEEACKLWPQYPKLTWAALFLGFSLCHIQPRPEGQWRQHNEPLHSPEEVEPAFTAALAYYETGDGWIALPPPPPAWMRVGAGQQAPYDQEDEDDLAAPAESWGKPDVHWHSKFATEILKHIPHEKILSSAAKGALLDFLAEVLDWTIQKNAPPWVKSGRRGRSSRDLFGWTRSLGRLLGRIAGHIPLKDAQPSILNPIFNQEGEACWALLAAFASRYICAHVYDAATVPTDALATLALCLERLLQDSVFDHEAYRAGETSGFDQPDLVKALLFVEVENAPLAARYVNGDWSDIQRILPLVDRFIRAAGWASAVMSHYLTLCERAKAHYPAETFADQILATLSHGPDYLKGWHGSSIPARIAELVQHFSLRDARLLQLLAPKLLRILDYLIDLGDRRSAALQLGEAFRDRQITGHIHS